MSFETEGDNTRQYFFIVQTDMKNKKTIFFYKVLSLIGFALLIFGLLERHSAVRNINIFSVRNIAEVSLLIIITVLIAVLFKKFYFKNKKLELPLVFLLKKVFPKHKHKK